MVQESMFELIHKKHKQARAKEFKELEKERKKLTDPEEVESEPPPPKKKQQTVQEAKKTIQLRDNLRTLLKQTQANELVDTEEKENQFKPTTKRLDKVEKAVIQTDADLTKKLELLPKFKPKQLTFTPEEEPIPLSIISDEEDVKEKSIKAILDKGTEVTSKGFGVLPRKYLPFPDNKIGIWYDEDNFYIGDKKNKILVDGDDLLINDKKYKGNHGLWRFLTNPNKESMDQETYNTWWTNKDNFSENDLASYKNILVKIHSIYQNNNPLKNKPKSSSSKKWNELVSHIWKETKTTPKTGSGLTKGYHEKPIEYRYVNSFNQLMQRLYFLHAEEKAGNNNFHNEKIGLKFF